MILLSCCKTWKYTKTNTLHVNTNTIVPTVQIYVTAIFEKNYYCWIQKAFFPCTNPVAKFAFIIKCLLRPSVQNKQTARPEGAKSPNISDTFFQKKRPAGEKPSSNLEPKITYLFKSLKIFVQMILINKLNVARIFMDILQWQLLLSFECIFLNFEMYLSLNKFIFVRIFKCISLNDSHQQVERRIFMDISQWQLFLNFGQLQQLTLTHPTKPPFMFSSSNMVYNGNNWQFQQLTLDTSNKTTIYHLCSFFKYSGNEWQLKD